MISSIGKPLNKLFSLYLKKRMVEIENFMKSPLEVQDQALKKIIYTAKNTEFGLSNSFNYLRTSKEFKNRVLISKYDDLLPFIERAKNGESNILWPRVVRVYQKD